MSRTATPRDLVPEPHCVLGTLLRPFSLGHHLLFLRAGLPFAGNPDPDPDPRELALAVFICAAPYREHEAALLRADWESEFARWSKKLRPWPWQKNRFSHAVESVKFAAYLRAGYARPPVWTHRTGASIQFSAPWECLVQDRLVSGGYDHAGVLELYLPAAWYHYHTLDEIAQADHCTDLVKWRKIFYTEDDDARLHPPSLLPLPAGEGRGEGES